MCKFIILFKIYIFIFNDKYTHYFHLVLIDLPWPCLNITFTAIKRSSPSEFTKLFEILIKQFNGPFHFLLCTFTRTTSLSAYFNTYLVHWTLSSSLSVEPTPFTHKVLFAGLGLVPSWSDVPPPARPVTLRDSLAVTYNTGLPYSCTTILSSCSATGRSSHPRLSERHYSLKQDCKAKILYNGNICNYKEMW